MSRLGLKRVILLSMIAWVARFGLFAYGDFTSAIGVSMLLLSMIVYGCAFDFFNVSGSMYMARVAGEEMRASAQGLFMTMVNGFGLYIGSIISGHVIDYFTVNGVQDWSSFWLVFSCYALILAAVFWLVYRENLRNQARCLQPVSNSLKLMGASSHPSLADVESRLKSRVL